MRSSNNIEQFSFVEDKCLYDFNVEAVRRIEEKYALIDQTMKVSSGRKGKELWRQVLGDLQATTNEERPQPPSEEKEQCE